MSFKDTFTRTNSSENLRYDDNAAYHFYMTILIIVVIPLTYSLLKTIFNPFSHIPTLSDLEKRRQFRDKISKFKKENKYSYITFKFILKVLLLALILYGIVVCTNTIMQTGDEIKGFDPYEILDVDPDAPI
jgi:preprotein translocase subunit Sec63